MTQLKALRKVLSNVGGAAMAGAFAVGVAGIANSAHATLVHAWNFEEADGTAAPEIHDTAGTKPGNFAGNMSDINRSADVPAGIGSTRSLAFFSNVSLQTPNVNDYVDVYSPGTPAANYITMPRTADWSISLWTKLPATETGGGPTDKVLIGSAAGHADLEVRTGGYVVYSHYNGGYQDNVISANPINDNLWHNITLVHHYDGGTLAETADLYVDAVAQVTGVSATIANPSFPYKIGSLMTGPGAGGTFVSGLLDDIGIYDNALTQSDVNTLANVPEPASLGALALGGALVIGRRRRA